VLVDRNVALAWDQAGNTLSELFEKGAQISGALTGLSGTLAQSYEMA
jgi:hypothetical protein